MKFERGGRECHIDRDHPAVLFPQPPAPDYALCLQRIGVDQPVAALLGMTTVGGLRLEAIFWRIRLPVFFIQPEATDQSERLKIDSIAAVCARYTEPNCES